MRPERAPHCAALNHSVPGDLDLRVAALPSGHDPADLVYGGDIPALVKSVESSIPLLQFRLETELARFDLSEAEAPRPGHRRIR